MAFMGMSCVSSAFGCHQSIDIVRHSFYSAATWVTVNDDVVEIQVMNMNQISMTGIHKIIHSLCCVSLRSMRFLTSYLLCLVQPVAI